MNKILYAVFQCKEHNYIETLESLDVDMKDVIIFGSNDQSSNECEYVKTTEDNSLAKYKNDAIKYARKNKYEYVFLIENDIVIKNNHIFDEYIALMDKYDLGMVFYGYYGPMNYAMNNIPNPALSVKDGDTHIQDFIRIPIDAFIGINLNKNDLLFDVKFHVMEFNEYLKRCGESKIIPFDGFYFEVVKSYDMIGYCSQGILPKNITKENIESDNKYVKDNGEKFILKMSSNVNEVLDYLKER